MGRKVRVLGRRQRLSLDVASYALVLNPVRAVDSGTYSCFFNSQADRRLVKLDVLGKGEWFIGDHCCWVIAE